MHATSPPSSDTGTSSLPTHQELNGGPTALLQGRLVVDDECVRAEGIDGQGRWLLIWPPGYSRRGDTVFRGERLAARNGDAVTLTGGEYAADQYDFVRTLTSAIPKPCRGGLYFLVTDVE